MASESSTEVSLGDDGLLGRNLIVRRIFDLHYEPLLRFLRGRLGRRDDANDLAQEAYLRLCRQSDLEKLQGKERSYLFKVASNLVKDRHRRRITRHGAQPQILEATATPDAADHPQNLLEYKDTLAVVKKTLQTMDPSLRQVFLRRRLEGASYLEIAAGLGVSERTVERYMRRALGQLKEELVGSGGSPR